MYNHIKLSYAELLSSHVGLPIPEILALLEVPPATIGGDLAFPCFSLSKKLKQSPVAIAESLAPAVESSSDGGVWTCRAVGPYINARYQTAVLSQQILPTVLEQGADYGRGDPVNQTILIEGWSPNTHKMLHVGHLRNALVSETICSLYEFGGYQVIRSAYGGDIGAHVAKWIRYVQSFVEESIPQDAEAFCKWSGKIYAAATAKVDEDPDLYKAQIHETQRLLEEGDEELVEIWKQTRLLSIAGLTDAFDELGCRIDKFYRESDVEQPGIELVKQYVMDETIPAIKYSQGAIIADLEEYDLGVFVLLKTNGTSLYSTKDVALAYLKESDYDFDMSLYVVATEQNHHFQQLFKTLELVGYDTSKLVHMGYELVELPDGKMSSRKGTIIPYHTWRDDAIQQAHDLMAERDIPDKDDVARKVAFAALKFSMLLQDTYKKIRLDMNKSLSFEGETGPYIQYTSARMTSLLGKAAVDVSTVDRSLLGEDEHDLMLLLTQFASLVQQSLDEQKPSIIARYALDLSRGFNAYYGAATIITDDVSLTGARLGFVQAVQQVLHNVMNLLGLDIVEQM